MATATRQLREAGYTRTLRSQHADRLVYYVNASPEEIKGNESTVEGLPPLGSAHPDWPGSGMIAREYDVQPHGVESLVTVTYATSNMSGVLYAVPDVSGGQWLTGVTFEKVTVQIPYAFKRKVRVPKGPGEPDVEIEVWDSGTREIEETRTVLRIEWEIQFPTLADIIEFETQNNSLHVIQGYTYLFRVASITAKDNTNYRVVASWTYDDGTRKIESLDPSRYLLPGDGAFSIYPPPNPPGYMRNQYRRLEVLASPNVETAPPEVVQILDYRNDDPEGWKRFRGVPNL